MARRELGPAALAVAQAVARALEDASGPLVVGCSGGADSLALTAGVAWAARRLDVQPLAVIVDHGLQPGSAHVAAHVAETCRGLGVAARVETVSVGEAGGPEAAAREARRAALASHRGPILLGHTLDDQAESVLLGLSRGSGARSLAGMAPRQGRWWRPLLGLRRADTEAACHEWGLAVWTDPHNADARFARARARHTALPVLEDTLGPGVAEALARSAELLRADADALDDWANRLPVAEALEIDGLLVVPAAMRRRVLLRWLRDRGASPASVHVDAVETLVCRWAGQDGVDVPGGVVRRMASAPPTLVFHRA